MRVLIFFFFLMSTYATECSKRKLGYTTYYRLRKNKLAQVCE